MIDVAEYQKRLEEKFLAEGFVKLDEPIDTEEVWSVAMGPSAADYNDDFDWQFWEPAESSMLKTLIENGIKEFYCLDVYYIEDGVLVVTASRGDNPRLKMMDP